MAGTRYALLPPYVRFTKWNTDARKARAAKTGDRIGSRNGLAPERVDAF
jgi:hypothetical protein